ncbi:MAG: hypothetical protein QM704_04240 [Anaeromyxobacteraceae bacterium]
MAFKDLGKGNRPKETPEQAEARARATAERRAKDDARSSRKASDDADHGRSAPRTDEEK